MPAPGAIRLKKFTPRMRCAKGYKNRAAIRTGVSLRVTVQAISPASRPLHYSAKTLPRGANFDEKTARLAWIPDVYQMGTHHIAIAATDGTLESSLNFVVRIYGTTTGALPSPSTPGKPESPNKPENPEQTTRFRDLAGYDWAKDAIKSLAKDGVIKGTSADTFEPGCDIAGEDFALLVMRASLGGRIICRCEAE